MRSYLLERTSLDKTSRMGFLCGAGREDRLGFGAASGLRKKKTGGTSNREKAKNKNMPAVARVRQISRRTKSNRGKGKGFKGHVKGGNFDRSRK